MDHYGGKDNGRTHAPVPFYVSSLGYGILVNSARYLTVYAGSGVRKDSPNAPIARDRNTDKDWTSAPYSDAVSILVPARGVEIYLFAGPSPMDAIRRYNLYCGGGTLPPRWGLGFTQRTQKLYTADDVEREIDEFERRGFPLDFIGLEPGWQSKAYPCTLEWDKMRFPNPADFIQKMAKRECVLICGLILIFLLNQIYISECILLAAPIRYGVVLFLIWLTVLLVSFGWINWKRNMLV